VWITEYPDLDELEQVISTAFELQKEQTAENLDREDVLDLNLANIDLTGFWANGRGGSNTTLDVLIFIEPEVFRMSQVTRDLSDGVADFIEPSEEMADFFGGMSIRVLPVGNREATLENRMFDSETGSSFAYDLTSRNYLELIQNPPFGFEVTPVEEAPVDDLTEEVEPEDTEEPEEPVIPEETEPSDAPLPTRLKPEIVEQLPPQFKAIVDQEEPEEPEEEEEGPTREEILADKFPNVPAPLRPYAINEEQVEIPASKETKRVDIREPYDFEKELFTRGEAGTPIGEIREGIGEAYASGTLGGSNPAGTYPRTGIYIKHHLMHEGPSYPLEIYNDIVVYSAYVSQMYDGTFKPGSYTSMRVMMRRLANKNIDVEGQEEPENLILKIPEDVALERGLDIKPDHPQKDGKAPWLENRQYYTVNQDMTDHPAWRNITDWTNE